LNKKEKKVTKFSLKYNSLFRNWKQHRTNEKNVEHPYGRYQKGLTGTPCRNRENSFKKGWRVIVAETWPNWWTLNMEDQNGREGSGAACCSGERNWKEVENGEGGVD
jgi:hypothetical protein